MFIIAISPPNLSPRTTTAINHHPRHYLPPPPSLSSATTPITSTSTNHLASPDSSLPLPKVVDEADDDRSGTCIQLSKLRRLCGVIIMSGLGQLFCSGVDLTSGKDVFKGDVKEVGTDPIAQMERCYVGFSFVHHVDFVLETLEFVLIESSMAQYVLDLFKRSRRCQ
ncbi:hypothetical protein Hanom_Chr04g00281341 [Helianthus anomalus]